MLLPVAARYCGAHAGRSRVILPYNRRVISLELARELKVAQLPWRPRRGDLVMDRLNIAFIVLQDGTDDSGAVEIDTAQGVERRPSLGLTWIPRLDQLLTFLARHGPFHLSVRPVSEGSRSNQWQVTLSDAPAATKRAFTASDSGEAAGQALHYLLSQAAWRPGPAL